MNYVLLGAMFFHFVGDFILQNNYMASQKSKDFMILILHVVVYTLVMAMALIFYTQFRYQYGPQVAIPIWLKTLSLVFISHLAVDFTTSKITSIIFESAMADYKRYATSTTVTMKEEHLESFGKKYHEYFVVIGFDQFMHFLSLWAIIELLPVV